MTSLNANWHKLLLNDATIHGRRQIAAYPKSWNFIIKPGDKIEPKYQLPKLGAQLIKNSIDHLAPENLRAALSTPWDRMKTTQERTRALEVLNELDEDYTLLKASLLNDPEAVELLARDYDVIPDLDQGKYVWVYTEMGPRTISLSQLNGEKGDLTTAEEEKLCKQSPSLRADIFYFGSLVKANVDMPLRWERPDKTENGVAFVDLLDAAKEAIGNSAARFITLYIASSKPATPINWDRIDPRFHQYFSCKEITEMKDQYVAIDLGLSPCPRTPTLKVDIFFNRKLVKANVEMPLNWESVNLTEDGLVFVDFLETAKAAANIEGAGSLSVYIRLMKPSEPIDWYSRNLFTHQYFSCREVSAMKGQYVAIGLDSIGLSCAICTKRAFIGNKHYMETFCTEACHTTFIQSQAVIL